MKYGPVSNFSGAELRHIKVAVVSLSFGVKGELQRVQTESAPTLQKLGQEAWSLERMASWASHQEVGPPVEGNPLECFSVFVGPAAVGGPAHREAGAEASLAG